MGLNSDNRGMLKTSEKSCQIAAELLKDKHKEQELNTSKRKIFKENAALTFAKCHSLQKAALRKQFFCFFLLGFVFDPLQKQMIENTWL